ncbi:LuxR C-terminal-related transcriptional regulator [Lentimicrobium sp.]|jgi:DNA-binding CsgD family transcriptional regulator|uniref:response regulator transcription factor n=1 Tax=Lentimicrobium sp. TaxID=2034841 RepID=UPI0025FCE2A5|nr:LuxR C-terminal-related transcriptional regulator [Lentimicrobium sp.]MCO5255794.1 LuxR C-terminal-related transcriptional regulator [Lentimicrobium sp.]MCO5262736.1 LuxR C-terminal-related transcriptional regulator [Lentimicrobium sp.]HOP14006.1 LuxR C-terminal-related transcriptional regulator [Lentimicrobium sp.]HPF64981.1 LuxR C-terminal-related transcriptional regulator [Lentimicrobium sp.]HPJ62335.1 LuxR C-terminal-related transcriptional regulator [Lentimicrobium sp.]
MNKYIYNVQITPREKEILRLVALDHSSTEISELLGISIRTVETHRKNIIRKISNNSLSALTRHAIKLGLLDEYTYVPSPAGRKVVKLPEETVKSGCRPEIPSNTY